MHPNSIFTKKRLGLDNNVWIVMLLSILLSLVFCGYALINKKEEKPCAMVNIIVNGRPGIEAISFTTGTTLTFRSTTSINDKVVWDFGDNTKMEEGSTTSHAFNTAAIFRVRIVINGKCDFEKKVTIKEPPHVILDSIGNITENIIGEDHANTGEKLILSTPLEAQTYEWHVDNNKSFRIRNGKEVNYTFSRQGTYTIVLILDGDNKKRYTKEIIISKTEDDFLNPVQLIRTDTIQKIVKPIQDTSSKEPTPPSPPVVAPKKVFKVIPDETFKEYIQSLVCKEWKPKDFDDFLCQGENTPVIINNTIRKTFGAFCSEIQGKRIKIESVKAGRDNERCVINLVIIYDKKGFLGKNPCKN